MNFTSFLKNKDTMQVTTKRARTVPKKMQEEQVKEKRNYSYLLKFTLLPIIPLTILSFFANEPDSWIISGQDHFYFEMFSVVLSFIGAFYCISRGYALKDKFSLFVGLGFLVAGIIDLLHGFFAVLHLGETPFEAYFIPQTWVAGRIVLGIVLMIAITKFALSINSTKKDIKSLKQDLLIYASALTGLAGVVTLISLSQPFPYVVIDFVIDRPYEIISASFFSVALIYFYKNKLHHQNDSFYKGIALVLIISIFVNLIVSYSIFVYDTAFSVAHILKNISYLVFILALSRSAIQHYKIQENLASELLEIDTRKEEFASMVTHELRSPLTPIMGYCEALQRPKIMGKLTDKQLGAVDKIFSNSKRLQKLIGDVLDAQKLDMDKVVFDKREFEVDKLLDDIIEDFKFISKDSKIKIINKNTEKFVLKSDVNRINQVISNLVYNAVDFVAKNTGKIEIDAKQEDQSIVFSVRDNGIGIKTEDKAKLFKKFYQIDTSDTRKHGGAGLGLAICKGMVEKLGGKIWLESKINQGSIFYFSIPEERT